MTETSKTPFTDNDNERINQCISNVLNHYFKDMENHFNGDLYNLVIEEVERPLVQKVMGYTNNNQSNAASILGMSRGTLRKKIKQYNIDTEKTS
ncbi:MAG: helix-turn-helix domain-containing protein [Pseudomonadota bacterium]